MDNMIRISGIVSESIVDGTGIRYVIFTQGCIHNCKGCHNPETHDPQGGKLKSSDEIFDEVSRNPLLKGITFSGGEPFLQAEKLANLAMKIKNIGKDIWCYTGFCYEELLGNTVDNSLKLLSLVDVLVDGKFELEQRDLTLLFRGSKNQRVIDCKKSLRQKEITLW